MRPWIGPWLGAKACPACGCWDASSGPHAVACALMAMIHAYEAEVESGRVNAPGYWMTLEARLAAGG